MDPVGGAASILTLIQVAGFVAGKARDTCARLRHAPLELDAVLVHLAIIQAEAQQLQQILIDNTQLEWCQARIISVR